MGEIIMKYFFIGFLCLIFCIGIGIGLDYLGFKWWSFIEPKKEKMKREIFLNTRSYNEGKAQDLVKLRMEYLRTKDKTEREVIASTIRHMFAEYDENKINSIELRDFLKQIKYGEKE